MHWRICGEVPDNLDPSLSLDLFRHRTISLSGFQPRNKLVQSGLLLFSCSRVLVPVVHPDGQTFSVKLLSTRLAVLFRQGFTTGPDDGGYDGVVGERIVEGCFGTYTILEEYDRGRWGNDWSELVRERWLGVEQRLVGHEHCMSARVCSIMSDDWQYVSIPYENSVPDLAASSQLFQTEYQQSFGIGVTILHASSSWKTMKDE